MSGRSRAACALLLAAVLLAGCASLPPHTPTPPAHAFSDVASTRLARVAAANLPAEPAGLSGFRLLPEAAFAFDARIALARRAEKSLDVQYYVLHSDGVGLQLLRELRDAARRGVRVRLLIDDLYTAGQDELFSTLAAHPNVELRLFNPLPARTGSFLSRIVFSLHEFGRINHRMHNKQFIADNSFSVSGGRNIADEYFMQSGEANFIDMDVLASGPVVRAQSAAFDSYWNSEQVRPIAQVVPPTLAPEQARRRFDAMVRDVAAALPLPERDVLGRAPVARQLDAGQLSQLHAPAQVFADDPAKITRDSAEKRFAGSVTQRTLAVLASARSHVLIVSPYFIPGKPGMAHMKEATDNGVTVVVTTNSLGATDEPLVYAGYARYRDDMLKLGVVIYELAPHLSRRSGQFGDFGKSIGRLHAKMAVIDEKRVFVGSMNLDGRSASLNTETGLVIESPELAQDFGRLLRNDKFTSAYLLRLGPTGRVEWVEQDQEGRQVVYRDEPETSWFVEIKNWLLSQFVAEELL